jgi:hypothetical protein
MTTDIFAPPSKEELDIINRPVKNTDDIFAPPSKEELVAISQPTALEAAGRGALQGATFGFADELAGVIGALKQLPEQGERVFRKFSEFYKPEREESRALYKKAQETQPAAYMAGEVGGAIASSLIPIPGAQTKAIAAIGQAAKGSSSQQVQQRPLGLEH